MRIQQNVFFFYHQNQKSFWLTRWCACFEILSCVVIIIIPLPLNFFGTSDKVINLPLTAVLALTIYDLFHSQITNTKRARCSNISKIMALKLLHHLPCASGWSRSDMAASLETFCYMTEIARFRVFWRVSRGVASLNCVRPFFPIIIAPSWRHILIHLKACQTVTLTRWPLKVRRVYYTLKICYDLKTPSNERKVFF